jgi:hypothetical protein
MNPMFLFPIPDEVIDELSRLDDLDPDWVVDRREGFETLVPRRKEVVRWARCSTCNCQDLEWKVTAFGRRLVYNPHWGALSGRVHACPSEMQ